MQSSTTEIRVVPGSERQGGGDVLTDILRQGAQKLLAQAIEAEVAEWIDSHKDCLDDDGRRQVVRNGSCTARAVRTGSASRACARSVTASLTS